MVPGDHSDLSSPPAQAPDLIVLEATVQGEDPRGAPCIEHPWSLRGRGRKGKDWHLSFPRVMSASGALPWRPVPSPISTHPSRLHGPQLSGLLFNPFGSNTGSRSVAKSCCTGRHPLCTLMETSGTRGRALGSTNGRLEGSVPSCTSFPSSEPCSRSFFVSSRVSTPMKTLRQ